MAYLNTSAAQGSTFGFRAAAIFQNIATRIRQRRIYNETFDGLSALSNRDLADLGLHRCNLRQIARESAYNATH
ncbi:hypothetical protein Z946_3465 [Sulfitobacter noctilucicola]|uniref:Uncharacterized protein YjiS (DUF1127 family) n=2 Tax=Sulfitobacter noctilucicola TaxID=1342301 RepID=A0A7W6M9Q3_9RHOB|nr:DUF1127 domain-containing protein [Sulfitobacter noctilucicola]KIN64573.1 hypothetical protein Z946_3465 [Sulfitobacter noctilucicola]MBB4174272.1 uncharacterized protein YjiS (DUF1127 family) [Sulfitobacter noctilucicola]